EWEDHDLVLTTRLGKPVMPRSYDRALDLVIAKAGLPRLSSHGLRHTAATHMVQACADLGELRAVADVLGHSPEMLLRIYAHALPESVRAVVERSGQRAKPALYRPVLVVIPMDTAPRPERASERPNRPAHLQ